MRPLILLLCLTLLALGALAPPAHADTIQLFSLDGSDKQTLSGGVLMVALEALEIGSVTFDAVLTVLGSGDLTQSSSGLGVSGGSNPINDGEWLSFSLEIKNVSGGHVSFGGFAGVDLTFFGTDGEQAVFSTDGDLTTTGDNFLVAEGEDADPVAFDALQDAFTLFGNDDGGTVSFRVDSIDASFTATSATPEPGTLLLVGLGAVLLLRRRP